MKTSYVEHLSYHARRAPALGVTNIGDEPYEKPPGFGLRQSSGAFATVTDKRPEEKRQRTGAVQNAAALTDKILMSVSSGHRWAAKFAGALSAAAAILVAGCGTAHDKGPYLAQGVKTPAYESTEPVVLLDPGVQYSLTTTGQPQAHTLEDGRLEVIVQLRNRENRRIEVQANCVFKDVNGITTGDETPFQAVILTESATEQVRFVSMNDKAKRYTIRVRQAR